MRLFDAISQRREVNIPKVKDGAVPAAVVQAGVTDLEKVRLEVKENRRLSPDEVGKLVAAYRRGESERVLGERFGVHPDTVGRHVARAGAKRPVVKVTPAVLARARELYEAGWSGPRIGRELGLHPTTVTKALRRAGVRMRKPVA